MNTEKIIDAAPNVRINELDERLLRERVNRRESLVGPRVGDYVVFADGVTHRFSHPWDDIIQTSCGGSFYLTEFGGLSFSGGLDPGVPYSALTDTGETKMGKAWFFHNDLRTAHNAVYAEIPCRVYTTGLNSTHWRKKEGRKK